MKKDIDIIARVLKDSNLARIEENKDYRFLATQIKKELMFNKISNT